MDAEEAVIRISGTELDLARDFLRLFATMLTVADRAGDDLDDRREFHAYCDRRGLEATRQRFDLVTDAALVTREHYRASGGGWTEPDDLDDVPSEILAEGLERYGWRRTFLYQNLDE